MSKEGAICADFSNLPFYCMMMAFLYYTKKRMHRLLRQCTSLYSMNFHDDFEQVAINLNLQLGAMQIHDGLCDGKPKSGPLGMTGCIGTLESLRQLLYVFAELILRHIFHREFRYAGNGAQGNIYSRSLEAVLTSIEQQVVDDAPPFLAVHLRIYRLIVEGYPQIEPRSREVLFMLARACWSI